MNKNNPYETIKARIISKMWESKDTLTLKTDWKTKHDPGQFAQLGVPGIGEAPISFASWNDQYVEFTIRVIGNVTKALARKNIGDTIEIRGPYGRGYPMKHFKGNNLLIIGGGCGVAPLKGIIEYVEKNRENYGEVELYLGYRTKDDILYKHLVGYWGNQFKTHMTIDKNEGHFQISCPTGFVTDELERNNISTENKIVFLCGPPIMMEKTIPILLNKGFHEDQLWLSLERHMKCGVGKCGHCMVNGRYVCKDGPVFRYDEIKEIDE